MLGIRCCGQVGGPLQVNFLEDHGCLIESNKTAMVIDPHASVTMEYPDMIMTIKSNG